MRKGYVSEHITEKECSCNCNCGQSIKKQKLFDMFEKFRAYLCKKYNKDVPLDIHCLNRCKKHNWRIYKSKGMKWVTYIAKRLNFSKHIPGDALDCHSDVISIKDLHESAKECHKKDGILYGGLGIYPWGIHIDISRFRSW